jgi:uncharacterized protein YqgC (DUF456 family)
MNTGDLLIRSDLIQAGMPLLVMLFGLFGLIFPILPGLVIIWIGTLGFGLLAARFSAGLAMIGS